MVFFILPYIFDVTHTFVTCKTYLCNHSEELTIIHHAKVLRKKGETMTIAALLLIIQIVIHSPYSPYRSCLWCDNLPAI